MMTMMLPFVVLVVFAQEFPIPLEEGTCVPALQVEQSPQPLPAPAEAPTPPIPFEPTGTDGGSAIVEADKLKAATADAFKTMDQALEQIQALEVPKEVVPDAPKD